MLGIAFDSKIEFLGPSECSFQHLYLFLTITFFIMDLILDW
jgi:hypothetical protein